MQGVECEVRIELLDTLTSARFSQCFDELFIIGFSYPRGIFFFHIYQSYLPMTRSALFGQTLLICLSDLSDVFYLCSLLTFMASLQNFESCVNLLYSYASHI